jgi:lysozyme family protein
MIIIAIIVLALLASGIVTYLFFFYLSNKREQLGNEIPQAHTPDDDETMFDEYDAGIADTLAVIGIDTSKTVIDTIEIIETENPVSPCFEIAHAPVAIIEGGYQRLRQDSGNYNSRGELVGTNWGIAAPVAEKYYGRVVTTEDMKALPKHVANSIFRQKFWDRMLGDSFPTQELANIVYDGHVNHGKWGIRLLQRVVGVYEDGIVGPITMMALMNRNPQQVYNEYFLARLMFYWAIVRNRPNQMVFWNGWMNRLEHYLKDYTGAPYTRPNPRETYA